MKDFSVYTSSEAIQAEAFRIIARFVHNVYDGTNTDGVTGTEGYIMGIVATTENLLIALDPKEASSF
jgi:hypothetical protein